MEVITFKISADVSRSMTSARISGEREFTRKLTTV
jgi:hypothetical protein